MRPLKGRSPRKSPPSKNRRKVLPRELNVGEAKALFSQLVDEAARGGRFVIAKAGTPVARIAIEAPLPDEVVATFYISPLGTPDK